MTMAEFQGLLLALEQGVMVLCAVAHLPTNSSPGRLKVTLRDLKYLASAKVTKSTAKIPKLSLPCNSTMRVTPSKDIGTWKRGNMTKKGLSRWSSFAFSIASFLGTLLVSAIVIPWLLRFAYGWKHPQDASAGDAAGWALVFGAPILIPLILVIAVAISAWVYHTVRHPAPD
jgi:hypothetical protein